MAFSGLMSRVTDVLEGFLDPQLRKRIEALPRRNLNEFGVDPFGCDPEIIKLIAPALTFLKNRYFRVETHGAEHIPKDGRFLLIGNHSGQIPLDAAMVGTAITGRQPVASNSASPRMCPARPSNCPAGVPSESSLARSIVEALPMAISA